MGCLGTLDNQQTAYFTDIYLLTYRNLGFWIKTSDVSELHWALKNPAVKLIDLQKNPHFSSAEQINHSIGVNSANLQFAFIGILKYSPALFSPW